MSDENTTQLNLIPTLKPNEELEASERFLELLERSKEYAKQGMNENTRRGHESNWRLFVEWCEELGHSPLPANVLTIIAHATALADEGKKASTIKRRFSTIAKAHKLAGHSSPTEDEAFKEHFRRIRNVIRVAPNQKKGLLTGDIQLMLAHLPREEQTQELKLMGTRDRAMLLLGFVLYSRRSELAKLNVEDIEFREEGMLVIIRQSKTDQEGKGKIESVHYGNHQRTCPVRAMKAWLDESGITEGPIFRRIDRHSNLGSNPIHGDSIARIIKKYAKLANLNPADYAGHSLRRGGITGSLQGGVSIQDTMGRSHHDIKTFMQYVEEARLFSVNITVKLGL